MARRSEDWNIGLAQDLRSPEFAREFLLSAVEEGVPVQVVLGKVDQLRGRTPGRRTNEHRAAAGHMTTMMRRTPALLRLETKLAADPCAILSRSEIRLLDREVRRALVSSFPELTAQVIDRTEDTIRWHALAARCREARGSRGIRDVSVAIQIPQYRLRAIESCLLREVRADLAWRYFRFLRIEAWVAKWCRANRELASRTRLLDGSAHERRTRRRRPE
jgi:hypothetical protein